MRNDLSCMKRAAFALAAVFSMQCSSRSEQSSSEAVSTPAAGNAPTAGAVGNVATPGKPSASGGAGSAAAGSGSTSPARPASAAGAASAGTSGAATASAAQQSPASASGGSAVGATAGAQAAAGSGSSAVAGAGATTGASAAGSGAVASAWPTADLGADGPFKQMTMKNAGPNNAYQLSYPAELGKDGLKHPIVTWGNGAGSTPDQYTLLPRMATHGFVVIAANSSSVTAALLKGGIDWLIMENGRDGSVFKDKLDPSQVASMGYSLGSLATFEAATDPRIKTTVHISGGSMTKSVVANLHGPAAFYCGNSDDIAYSGCEGDFEITKVPTIYANFPGDHLGVRNMATAPQIAKATVGWLRWRLMGDKALDAMFVGPDCGLCKDSAWDKVQQKMLDMPPP